MKIKFSILLWLLSVPFSFSQVNFNPLAGEIGYDGDVFMGQ